MRATIGRRVPDGVVPIVEVRLTSNGMQTDWLAADVGHDEQILLLRHLTDDPHAVPVLEGRGRSQRVVRRPGVPGRADHLHAALVALRPPYVVLAAEGDDPFGRDLLVTPKALRFRTEAKLPGSWTVGRRDASGTVVLCDLRRAADGSVTIEQREPAMTDFDARIIAAHFRLARWVETGGERGGALVSVTQYEVPGTAEHFVGAIYALPPPYALTRR